MVTTTSNLYAQTALVIARIGSVSVTMVGACVLSGWFFDNRALTSLYLPGPTLKTNAALCLMCGGLANLLLISQSSQRWGRVAHVLAASAALIGALTLSEHIVGWDLGIDELLATEPAGAEATMSPNRMGPPASSVNLMLGLALLLAGSSSARRRQLSQALAVAACVIVLLPLMGFAYGFSELYAIARYTGISLSNALALLVLGVSIQAGRTDSALVSLICRHDEVGVFARRLLPAAVLLPFGIGWLLARGLGRGLIDAPFAISAMALVLIVALAAVIWRTGAQLVRSLDARTAAERELAERERILREADHQKTEFLATLSHELRNPLAPIRFAVDLLNGPPATAERARKTIQRQIQHLTRLIDDLLDLTRVSRNKLELQLRPAELQQLISDAVDAVANEITQARHQLRIEQPPQPVWLCADPDRVVQILINLLTNATRYSEPGGNLLIGTMLDDASVTIFVRDSGQGIAAADLDRVFDRFVQVGHTRHGGLGIGLSLVKALAELHGGGVEAHSDGPGHGAEFRVKLPRGSAPSMENRAAEDGQVAPCRILVVDDNRDAADMLGGLLTAAGHRVLVSYDGEDALRRAPAFKPQIGLLDIGMPGMDGYQLASRLRSDLQGADLLLVAITGRGHEHDRQRSVAAGFHMHLTKPADPRQITELLARVPPAG